MRASAQQGKYGPKRAWAFAEPPGLRSGLHWVYRRELLHTKQPVAIGDSVEVVPQLTMKDARVCRAYGMVSRPPSKKSGGPVQPIAFTVRSDGSATGPLDLQFLDRRNELPLLEPMADWAWSYVVRTTANSSEQRGLDGAHCLLAPDQAWSRWCRYELQGSLGLSPAPSRSPHSSDPRPSGPELTSRDQ